MIHMNPKSKHNQKLKLIKFLINSKNKEKQNINKNLRPNEQKKIISNDIEISNEGL